MAHIWMSHTKCWAVQCEENSLSWTHQTNPVFISFMFKLLLHVPWPCSVCLHSLQKRALWQKSPANVRILAGCFCKRTLFKQRISRVPWLQCLRSVSLQAECCGTAMVSELELIHLNSSNTLELIHVISIEIICSIHLELIQWISFTLIHSIPLELIHWISLRQIHLIPLELIHFVPFQLIYWISLAQIHLIPLETIHWIPLEIVHLINLTLILSISLELIHWIPLELIHWISLWLIHWISLISLEISHQIILEQIHRCYAVCWKGGWAGK